MGFRRKIKDRIKRIARLEGRPEETIQSVVTSDSITKKSNSSPVAKEPSEPKVIPNQVQPSPVAEKKESKQEQNAVDAEKVAKHLARTRIGILKFVVKQGGTSSLADMHSHSERRFFVGHKKFSDMMEAMVDDGLLLYSWEAQEATITDLGKEAIKK
jgi:hypothetical protein